MIFNFFFQKQKPEIKQTHHHIIQQLNETNEDEEDDDDDDENNQAYANHNDSVYKQWTKNHQRHSKTHDSEDDQPRSAAIGTKKRKEQQQFSKSFEVSLDDLDNLIDRVDNGIKLKKSNNNKSNDTPKKQQQQQETTSTAQATINIESLKQEWSNMFNKLEQDYKSKLDEQQKQNEFRLKQLHDEIKQSILLQNQQKEQNVIIFLT